MSHADGEGDRDGGSATRGGDEWTVDLEVDGRPVDLKAFLHDMIGGAVTGLVSGLRDVAGPTRVVLRVERRD